MTITVSVASIAYIQSRAAMYEAIVDRRLFATYHATDFATLPRGRQ